jgi:2',3'-cyclic-nucleotide 2'-phosphodiesterase (5'-nucleotidase family)
LLTLQRVGDLEQGRLLAEAFGQMGYDAMALGGMDFRMGLDVLREQILAADYAVLSANTLDPQTGDWFDKPYVILERGGHRIALIGLTDPQIAVEVTGGEVEVAEPVSTLMEVVAQVKDEADVIIVLSHLGMAFDLNLRQVVPEVDVIVSGKDKEVYDPPLEAGGVLIVSAGSRGEYVGRVDLEFDAQGNLVSHESEMQALTEDIADDVEMRQWMAQVGLTPASALKSGSDGQLSQ